MDDRIYSSSNMSNIKNNYDEWNRRYGGQRKIEYKRSKEKKTKLNSVYTINRWCLRHATNVDQFGNDDNSVAKLAAYTRQTEKIERENKKKTDMMQENEGRKQEIILSKAALGAISQHTTTKYQAIV